ncbi:hypothetical protein ACSBR2_026219 [Camellia fascicularis]
MAADSKELIFLKKIISGRERGHFIDSPLMFTPLVAGVSCSCQHSRFEVETLVMKICSLNCM